MRQIGGDAHVSTIMLGVLINYLGNTEPLKDRLMLEHARQVVIRYFKETLLRRKIGVENLINKNINALEISYEIMKIK